MTDIQQLTADLNGHAGLTGDEQIIAAIEAQSAAARARAAELRAELERITPELRRYDKAIAALRGESLTPGKPKKKDGPPSAKYAQKVSPEAVDRIWEAVQKLTGEGGQDEFTQVQARTITGDTSGVSSLAFEALRQDGKIRFARRDGNQKVFRLTHAEVES